MKKALIVLVLLLAIVYLFFWQTSFESGLESIKVIDGEFLEGDVLPAEEDVTAYKKALKGLLADVALKGETKEKNALSELIGMKLEALEFLGIERNIEEREKLLNLGDPECVAGGVEEKAIEAYGNGLDFVDSMEKKIASFEKKYPEYYAKAETLQRLRELLPGFGNYFNNSIKTMQEICA